MKNKEFKPIVIGYNASAESNYKANLSSKIERLTQFFEECTKYVDIKDKNAYKPNLYNSFVEDFSAKYKSQFSELLTIDKILELSEVPVDKLRFLAAKINEIDIDLDFNTHEASTPDFSIKTESIEENLLYEYSKRIAAAIHDNKPEYMTFFYADLVRGFANILQYDFNSQKLVPNVSYIKGQYRRF
jgi:hypothetical protein